MLVNCNTAHRYVKGVAHEVFNCLYETENARRCIDVGATCPKQPATIGIYYLYIGNTI